MRAKPTGAGTGDLDAGESSEIFMTMGFMATDPAASYDDDGSPARDEATELRANHVEFSSNRLSAASDKRSGFASNKTAR